MYFLSFIRLVSLHLQLVIVFRKKKIFFTIQ